LTPAAGSSSRTSSGSVRADELHELLLAVREIARELARAPLELDELEQLLGAAPRRRVAGGRHHQQVLERGQLGEDPDHLEGAAHAQMEDLVRLEAIDPAALEEDLALVGLVHPGDAVEERGLAGAVGPMSPQMRPAPSASETLLTAATPPKRFTTGGSRGWAPRVEDGPRQVVLLLEHAQDPAGIQEHHPTMIAPKGAGGGR
jgi:hypothetical protein